MIDGLFSEYGKFQNQTKLILFVDFAKRVTFDCYEIEHI